METSPVRVPVADSFLEEYRCQVCPSVQSTKQNLVRHYAKVHRTAAQLLFTCLCDREFTNLRSAREHARKEHCEQVNALKTEASQKRFSGAGASNATSGALGHRPLEFRCDNCSRCFRNAGGLRNHNRVCRVPDATRDQLLHSPHASRLAPAASASTVDPETDVLVDQTQPELLAADSQPDPVLVVDMVADSQPQVLVAASQTPPAAPQGDTPVLNYLPSSLPLLLDPATSSLPNYDSPILRPVAVAPTPQQLVDPIMSTAAVRPPSPVGESPVLGQDFVTPPAAQVPRLAPPPTQVPDPSNVDIFNHPDDSDIVSRTIEQSPPPHNRHAAVASSNHPLANHMLTLNTCTWPEFERTLADATVQVYTMSQRVISRRHQRAARRVGAERPQRNQNTRQNRNTANTELTRQATQLQRLYRRDRTRVIREALKTQSPKCTINTGCLEEYFTKALEICD